MGNKLSASEEKGIFLVGGWDNILLSWGSKLMLLTIRIDGKRSSIKITLSSQTGVCEQTPHKVRQVYSLVVRWLRLCDSIARAFGLIPGRGTKIMHVSWCSQKIKNKQTTTTKTIGRICSRGPKFADPSPELNQTIIKLKEETLGSWRRRQQTTLMVQIISVPQGLRCEATFVTCHSQSQAVGHFIRHFF